MKLKNKISGEIKEFALFDGNELQGGATLESLTKEWEDVKEPKEHYWVIDEDGVLVCRAVGAFVNEEMCKQIGNYFETKEEAEKAVEKLKAWKRLKDAGFRFGGWETDIDGDLISVLCNRKDRVQFNNAETLAMAKDLDLLFGGEE